MWQDRAACAGKPETLFFPSNPKGARIPYLEARRICERCPVREECLDAAMAEEVGQYNFRFGMRGGLTPQERRNRSGQGPRPRVLAESGAA